MTEPRKPIFWYQGLFLQPQHFQQTDLFTQSLLSPLRQYLQPYFWGVCKMKVNESSLRENTFEVSEGQFIFQDGTWVSLSGNARVKPRSFKDAWKEQGAPFTVYLGLRKWSDIRNNVTVLTGRDFPSDLDTRLVCGPAADEVGDLYQQGQVTQVKLLDYGLRLFWETEIEEAGEYHLLAVARLEFNGQSVVLSQEFVPPAVTMAASENLLTITKNLRDLVSSRCRLLEAYKNPKVFLSSEIPASYLHFFLALRSLNRYIPLLCHITEVSDLHPWNVYGLLRQLVGELSSFSERVDALGKVQDGTELLPLYDHENLGTCFRDAQLLIDEILDSLFIGMENIIHLTRDGDYFRAKIPADLFESRYMYYLQVKTGESSGKIIDMAEHVVKLGCDEEIGVLMKRALPGVHLEPLRDPAPGLARRPDVLYFKVDSSSRYWYDIQKSYGICLYWKDAPEDMAADLIIIKQ